MISRRLKIAAVLVAIAGLAGVASFHPSRPLYMRQRALDVVAADGAILRATLSLPRWRSGPFPAMVMVHGSGRLAREHLVGDVRQLVWHGFAVLAYDKRGVGESGGEYPSSRSLGAETTLRLLAADATAAFSRLRKEPEIDPARVGFFGASQASWIIPLATEALDPKPHFQVILSGAAVSTGVEQFYSDLTGDGHRPPQLTDREEIVRLVNAFDGEPGFDPLPVLRASRVPTLWLLGDRDQSVPTFATVDVLQALPPEAAAYHTVVRYPDADHSLRDVNTGEAAPVWSAMLSWMETIGVTSFRPRGVPANNRLQRTALRPAADAERWIDSWSNQSVEINDTSRLISRRRDSIQLLNTRFLRPDRRCRVAIWIGEIQVIGRSRDGHRVYSRHPDSRLPLAKKSLA